MLTGSYKLHKHHVRKAAGVEVLRAAAVYGANGAGKSNLVKAMDALRGIATGEKGLAELFGKTFRLAKGQEEKPITFEAEIALGKKVFYYAVSCTASRIVSESLHQRSGDKDVVLFSRKTDAKGKHKLVLHARYLKTAKAKLFREMYESGELLGAGEAFLAASRERGYLEVGEVLGWFEKGCRIVYPETKFDFLCFWLLQDGVREFVNEMIESLSTGVKSLSFERMPLSKYFGENKSAEEAAIKRELDVNGDLKAVIVHDAAFFRFPQGDVAFVIRTEHDSDIEEMIKFSLDEESDGTRRLLDFLMILWELKENETTVIVDEIDQSIHPHLLKTFLTKVLGEERLKGQLIFTTHESNLLDLSLLRQDEIWFAEKDGAGATQLYSLSDFKPRHDLDIRKGYLQGRYGAIPFLGDFERLNLTATPAAP